MWWCGTVFVAFCFERGTPRKPFSWSQQQSTRRASNAAHSSTQTTTRAIGTLYPRLVMHILTHILLICLWLDVVWAQASAPGPSPAQKTNNEDLSELALWPDVDIRGLLVGETNATEKTPSPVDLLFVLQADSATLVPASDGGLLGGHLLLGGVLSQVVAFADRPYRTMDMISLEEFFAFELIQEFFAGRNPPNAIITGELPHDIASQRWNESDWLPYRRLLGTVLGAAAYDLQRPSELRFDIPRHGHIKRRRTCRYRRQRDVSRSVERVCQCITRQQYLSNFVSSDGVCRSVSLRGTP